MIAFSPHFLLDGITAAGVTAAALHTDDPDRASPVPAGPVPAGPVPAGAGSADSGPLGPEPAAASQAGAFIRLEFTSPTRPAVITGGHPDPGMLDFRYLVVPLRAAAR